MIKGLEALKDIKSKPFSWEKLKDSLDIIEKELKALEIIKAKLSPLAKSTFLPMSQEEFDLVNEVLL